MEHLDESPPTKRLCQPVDITPSNIDFDHDAWDIAEAFPDVIRDIESSLKDAKPDSAAALLGFDLDFDGDDHFNGLNNRGSSYQELGKINEATDLCMMDETEDTSRDDQGGGEEEEDDESFADEVDDDGWIIEQRGSDDEMIVLDEDGYDDEDIKPDISTLQCALDSSGCPLSNNASGLPHKNDARTSNTDSAGGTLDDDVDEDDREEEGEEMMEEWDSDSDGDLDALLDEGLPDQYKQSKGEGTQPVKGRKKAGEAWRKVLTHGGALPEGLIGVKEKTVLKRHGQEPLEGLPDGWIRISHQCGMPLYLHRPSRVCSWSRPYLLGSGSARRHRIPVTAIPCMHYSRALEKEKKTQQESESKEDDITIKTEPSDLPNGNIAVAGQPGASSAEVDNPVNPDVEMKDPESSINGDGPKGKKKNRVHICEDDSVDVKDLQEYLSRLFQFEKITIKRFNSWAARRKHTKAVKHKDRPQFPGGPKVIRCQIPGKQGREFVINAQDKTPVCILHEYAQRVMRTQPSYVFGESRNASAPFEAVVEIKGVKYGRGEATSKRLAKAEAAKKTLDILVPELISDFKAKSASDTEYFDHVAIDDIRIYDLCMKAGQLTPWQVLQEYIQRSHGMADTKFSMNIKLKNHQRSEYTLTLGPHTVTGMCKNKANGKQQGAQKLLKQLHPELRSWGAIIKMYGKGSSEINREKKEAEQSVTELTHDTPRARPNRKILNKLRFEMMKKYGEKSWLDAEVERQKKQGDDVEQEMMEEEDIEKEPS